MRWAFEEVKDSECSGAKTDHRWEWLVQTKMMDGSFGHCHLALPLYPLEATLLTSFTLVYSFGRKITTEMISF